MRESLHRPRRRSRTPDRPSRARSRARSAALGVAFIAFAALLAAGAVAATPQRAVADDRPPGGVLSDPAVRAVDIAAPSIVRIVAVYTGRITLDLCGRPVTLPANGGTYTLGWTGSGAFVSPTGDILTAGHVVDDSKDSLDAGLFESGRPSRDIAAALDANAGCLQLGGGVTADDVANGAVQALGIPFQTSTTAPAFSVYKSTSFTGALPTGSATQSFLTALQSVPHEVGTVRAFSRFDQDDLGVLHVNLTDTPSIQLDNSAEVAAQDKLTILGFPGNGDINGDPSNLLTFSVNTVTVSAIKKFDNGSSLIQVGGNVEHGDSGGPALDAQGHIVGVVSFGNSSSTPSGTSFLRASNSALTLLAQAGVSNTTPGAFQAQWQQAFTDYAASYVGHWHTAAQELDALNLKYPDFHGVTPFRAYAETAAARETVTPDNQAPSPVLLGGVAALVLVLLLALVIGLVVASRRRRAQAARLAAAPSAPAYGYPPYALPPMQAGMPGGPMAPMAPYGPPTGYPPSWSSPANGSNGAAGSEPSSPSKIAAASAAPPTVRRPDA